MLERHGMTWVCEMSSLRTASLRSLLGTPTLNFGGTGGEQKQRHTYHTQICLLRTFVRQQSSNTSVTLSDNTGGAKTTKNISHSNMLVENFLSVNNPLTQVLHRLTVHAAHAMMMINDRVRDCVQKKMLRAWNITTWKADADFLGYHFGAMSTTTLGDNGASSAYVKEHYETSLIN